MIEERPLQRVVADDHPRVVHAIVRPQQEQLLEAGRREHADRGVEVDREQRGVAQRVRGLRTQRGARQPAVQSLVTRCDSLTPANFRGSLISIWRAKLWCAEASARFASGCLGLLKMALLSNPVVEVNGLSRGLDGW